MAAAATTASFTQRISHPDIVVPAGSVRRRRHQHVRGGRWRFAGQQAAQAQTPEHGGRGRSDPPTVPAQVPAASATVCARVRGTPTARLVVAHAFHADVAVRSSPVAGPVRSVRGTRERGESDRSSHDPTPSLKL